MRLQFDVEKGYEDFSLKAAADLCGSRIGMFGRSGSGKSTLAHIISGLLMPERGELSIEGECLLDTAKKIHVPARKRRIGLVFQQPSLFPHLKVAQNLLYGYRRNQRNTERITLPSVSRILGLEALMHRRTQNLSGGEKQRVALGRAILANPRLLIMDEPLSALDDTLRFQIIPYLKSVSESLAIPMLFISHSVLEMQLLCDTVLTLENGSLSGKLTPDALARRSMADNGQGYTNLLHLEGKRDSTGLFSCRWGNTLLQLSEMHTAKAVYELSSRDIILFRKHPEAISARNLLECRVGEVFDAGSRLGVVLAIGGAELIAEIVRPAAEELAVGRGSTLFAAIKASSFRRIIKETP